MLVVISDFNCHNLVISSKQGRTVDQMVLDSTSIGGHFSIKSEISMVIFIF